MDFWSRSPGGCVSTKFAIRRYDKMSCERLEHAGILRPIAQALAARGVSDPQDLLEDWRSMLPPALLEGSQKAAEILADAIERGRHVTVVADYDCDGATACAIAVRGLRMMGLSVDYIVPDRFKLGYGLTPAIVEMAAARETHPDLIITVDNGIASVDGVRRANELGIDVIITDPHLPGEKLPDAACIVNPNVVESTFASKALAGCGVMFYVLLALRAELRKRGVFTAAEQPRIDQLSDLVALGTVADVVKLDKNNRILVSQGLARIRRGLGCPGIKALFAVAGRDISRATARDFAFAIAPRINAAGRLTEMGVGIECLLADDDSHAQALATDLENLNRERRDLEGSMQLDAVDLLSHMNWEDKCTVTLFDPSWHQGVVGLVASRLKEKTHRPVIAFARDDENLLKGSGRSIDGVHLRDALDRVSKYAPDLIVRFGGHALAAGLTIQEKDLERFSILFEKAVAEMVEPEVFDRIVYVDGALSPEEISFTLINAMSERIWGQGFERPLFANDFTILSQRVIKDTHLKLVLDLAGNRFEGIFFRRSNALPSQVRLAYRPEVNEYMGRRTIQLVVEAAEA